jgi:hypothetical protein
VVVLPLLLLPPYWCCYCGSVLRQLQNIQTIRHLHHWFPFFSSAAAFALALTAFFLDNQLPSSFFLLTFNQYIHNVSS